jgi:tetratricopeptide (TPR) repeat protein
MNETYTLFNLSRALLRSSIVVLSMLILGQPNCVLAQLEFPEAQPAEEVNTTGTVTSIEAFNSIRGNSTGSSLQLAAKYASNNGNYEEAIKWSKLALEKDPDDIDSHMSYAEALEQKLKTKPEKERDHNLLNECVNEWLIVYRSEVGEEKGAGFHGINPLGHLYEDEERSIPARHHIVTLVGRAPKPWETDTKFMKWVDRPDTSVAGKIISSKSVSSTVTTDKSAKAKGDSNEDIEMHIGH